MKFAVKFLFGMAGALVAVSMFWGTSYMLGWEPPTWAYFIMAWVGHSDFFDALTYKKDESWYRP